MKKQSLVNFLTYQIFDHWMGQYLRKNGKKWRVLKPQDFPKKRTGTYYPIFLLYVSIFCFVGRRVLVLNNLTTIISSIDNRGNYNYCINCVLVLALFAIILLIQAPVILSIFQKENICLEIHPIQRM